MEGDEGCSPQAPPSGPLPLSPESSCVVLPVWCCDRCQSSVNRRPFPLDLRAGEATVLARNRPCRSVGASLSPESSLPGDSPCCMCAAPAASKGFFPLNLRTDCCSIHGHRDPAGDAIRLNFPLILRAGGRPTGRPARLLPVPAAGLGFWCAGRATVGSTTETASVPALMRAAVRQLSATRTVREDAGSMPVRVQPPTP